MRRITAEELAKKFNQEGFALMEKEMSTSRFTEVLRQIGLPCNHSYPEAFESAGYISRTKRDGASWISMPEDPTHQNKFMPLLVEKMEKILKYVREKAATSKRLYNERKKARDQAKIEQETFGVTEECAIRRLKALGYKILKPTVQYNEV